MSIAILIFALLGFVYLAWKNTIWGIAVVVALLPTYLWRFDFWGLPTTFLELMILALFVVWLLEDKRYKRINIYFKDRASNLVPKPLRYLLTFWILASLIALATNFMWGSLGLWRAYFLEPLMFFLVIVYSVRDKRSWQMIVKAFGFLLAYLLVIALCQYFSSWNFIAAYNPPNVLRLTGPFAYPNALSLLTAPLSALFFGAWFYSQHKKRQIHYLLLGFVGLALAAMAVSEGAMAAILFSVFLMLILAKKIHKFGIAFLVLAIISLILFMPKLDMSPELNLQSSSLDIRLNQWQETSQFLSDHFFLGSGLAGYQVAMESYHQTEWLEIYLYPHNIFLNFWTELGLLGLLVFLGLLIYVFIMLKDIFKENCRLAWPLIMMWSTWVIHGLVDVPYFKNDLALLFFTMLALTVVAHRQKTKINFY